MRISDPLMMHRAVMIAYFMDHTEQIINNVAKMEKF
jgi:hypothetical protein